MARFFNSRARMQTVPIHQAKSQLSELIRAVEQGEEVVLTRHGKRVIRLIKEPESEQPSIEARRQAIMAELEALRGKVGKADPAFRELWDEHKRERDAHGDAWTDDPKALRAGR
jgi:prevent-host-death family protein